MKKVLFLTTALIMSAMMWAGETKTLIIDGSQLTSTATSAVTDFTYGDFTIAMSDGAKFQASSGDNRFEGTDKAILIGKSGKYIYNKTPFGKITKFEIYANKGASAKVSVGVLFSTTAISSYSEGANTYTATLSTLDNVYDCSAKIPDGAQYFWYQVTNANNSQVMFRITYEDGDTPQRTLQSIYIDGEATKLEYREGESFEPTGLKVMGVYDSGDDTEITAGIEWTIVPETLTLGTTSVDVTAQYKDFTSKVFTVNNIVVTEKPAPVGGVIIIDPATQTAITTAADINVTIEDINVAYNGTLLTTDPAQFRVYANKTLTLTANESIKQVRIIGYVKAGFTLSVDKGNVTTGDSYSSATTKSTWEDPLIVIEDINSTSVVLSPTKQMQAYKIEVTLSQTPTAMPEVMENANVSKQLINGQLIIIRDNVRYNVAGQQL